MTKPETWPRGRWRVNQDDGGFWILHAPDCGGWNDDGGSCTDLGLGTPDVTEALRLARKEIAKHPQEVTA